MRAFVNVEISGGTAGEKVRDGGGQLEAVLVRCRGGYQRSDSIWIAAPKRRQKAIHLNHSEVGCAPGRAARQERGARSLAATHCLAAADQDDRHACAPPTV